MIYGLQTKFTASDYQPQTMIDHFKPTTALQSTFESQNLNVRNASCMLPNSY